MSADSLPESTVDHAVETVEPVVEYEIDDGIARVHLNRPHRLNAVTNELIEQLLGALRRAESDGARAIVLAGRGRAFCSGYDLKEPDDAETTLQTRVRIEHYQDVTRAVRRFPGIVIAAVHGYALGAGCEFALGCDLIVAADDATFGFPEVSVGLSVTGGISALLPSTVGPARAKELLVLGEQLDATTAERLGLVNRVVAEGRHEIAALAWATIVRDRPATATAIAKQAIDRGRDSTVEEAFEAEVDYSLITRDANEAEVFGD